jgi:hypothetical protein
VTIQEQAIRELVNITKVKEITSRCRQIDLWRERWLHRVCIQVSIQKEVVANYPEHAERMKESAREELAMSLAPAFEFEEIGPLQGGPPPFFPAKQYRCRVYWIGKRPALKGDKTGETPA